MREIKYRAFDIVTGEMKEIESIVFYKKIDENGMMGEVFYHGASSSRYFGENTNGFDMEQCKLIQYTGLKDKNNTGTEIYFDDIVHIYGYGDLHIKDMGDVCQLYEAIAEGNIGEIKSNIYENPSLLENE